MDIERQYTILEDTVRQDYVSVVWSHKIQEKQSDIYAERFKHMETLRIVLAALTSGGIITTIFVEELWLKVVSSILSVVTAFINSYFKSFDIQSMSLRHKSAANSLWRIREELLILLTKIKLQVAPVSDLSNEHADIISRLSSIYLEAPSTTDEAVNRASKALNGSKDNTYTDDEIDKFLPHALRKGK